jgi:preprotein translocase subunit SecF
MKRVIDFLRLRYIFFGFSVVLIVAGIAGYFLMGGFNLGIDFTAGLTQQVQINPQAVKVTIADMRQTLAPLERFDLQVVGNPANQEFAVKVMAPSQEQEFQTQTENRIQELLGAAYGAGNVTIESSDFVGPRYSRELATQTITVLAVALVLILIYAAVRFQLIYGAAAVLCLVHDSLFMLAVLAITRIEFTTTMVAAVLTIIGYSINDTIVIFDRVRENRPLMRDAPLITILNTSITQTLSRTILTSATTLLAIIGLYVIGSGDIKNFALIMIVGIVEGTYSTIFIASPIVLEWTTAVEKRRRRRDMQLYGRQAAAQAAPHLAAQGQALPRPVEEEAEALQQQELPLRQEGRAFEAVQAPPAAGGPPGAPSGGPGSAGAPAPGTGGGRGPVTVVREQPTRKKKKKKRKH